jgi:C4-dicarboxylate transporter, DctM subunit
MIIVVLLCVLAVLMLALGFEMLLVMGVPSVLNKILLYPDMPSVAIAQRLLGGVEVVTLLAIPFFIFAADLMARGKMAQQLADLFRTLFGAYRGGIGHSTVAAVMVFGAAAGSAPATVAAMGRLSYPELKRAGFSDRFSLGLIASSAETALLIPPSITFVVYAWLTGTSIAALFAAGLVVGIVLGLAFMVLVAWEAQRRGLSGGAATAATLRWRALREAVWALGMQVIILAGIFAGIFTATEAAAVSAAYAILVEVLVLRSLTWRDVFNIAQESALSTSVIFVLLAVGSLLAYFITLGNLQGALTQLIEHWNVGWVGYLLAVNVLFLIAGMFIDANSIMLIFLPTLFPIAAALGIDPVHFGMVVTLNICIGMITPPFGLDLFVASSTLRRPVEDVVAGVWPFIWVNIAVLLLISYIPTISTALPKILL